MAPVKMRGLYDFYGAALVLSVKLVYICRHEHGSKYIERYGKIRNGTRNYPQGIQPD